MKEVNVSELEKKIALIESLTVPLVEKRERNTEATISLTHKIDTMIQNLNNTESIIKDHTDRLIRLEKKEAVLDSNKEFQDIFKKVLITGFLSSIFIGFAFVASLYFEKMNNI